MPLLCHWKTLLIYSSFCYLREQDENVILKLKLYNKARTSSEHEFHQQDRGTQRWGYQNRIRCQTVSSPHGAHPETLSTRFKVSWMKNNVHPRSGTQQCSAEFTTRHHFKSLLVVSLTSNTNITKIYSSSCVCGDWTNSTRLLLPVKQAQKYVEPTAENNTDLTDRFPLLCNNYSIWESTVYLHDRAI